VEQDIGKQGHTSSRPSSLTWCHDSPSPLLDACCAPLHSAATFGEGDEGMRGCASPEASRGACVSPAHASVVGAGSGLKGSSWSVCKSGSMCKSGSKGSHQERSFTDREDARRRKGEAKAQRRRDRAHRRDAAALTPPKDGTLAFPDCSYTQAQQKRNAAVGSVLSSTHLMNARLVLCTTPKVLPTPLPRSLPALCSCLCVAVRACVLAVCWLCVGCVLAVSCVLPLSWSCLAYVLPLSRCSCLSLAALSCLCLAHTDTTRMHCPVLLHARLSLELKLVSC